MKLSSRIARTIILILSLACALPACLDDPRSKGTPFETTLLDTSSQSFDHFAPDVSTTPLPDLGETPPECGEQAMICDEAVCPYTFDARGCAACACEGDSLRGYFAIAADRTLLFSTGIEVSDPERCGFSLAQPIQIVEAPNTWRQQIEPFAYRDDTDSELLLEASINAIPTAEGQAIRVVHIHAILPDAIPELSATACDWPGEPRVTLGGVDRPAASITAAATATPGTDTLFVGAVYATEGGGATLIDARLQIDPDGPDRQQFNDLTAPDSPLVEVLVTCVAEPCASDGVLQHIESGQLTLRRHPSARSPGRSYDGTLSFSAIGDVRDDGFIRRAQLELPFWRTGTTPIVDDEPTP